MDKELKFFIENNFDFLVRLYNRYVRFMMRYGDDVEYYASPMMNLQGYPSEYFLSFCTRYYNKKQQGSYSFIVKKKSVVKSFFRYGKLIFVFFFSSILFQKKIDKKSIVVHAFHKDSDLKKQPYTTMKTPPLESFESYTLYHEINLSFISLKHPFSYRKHSIVSGLRFLSFWQFLCLHGKALRIYYMNYTFEGNSYVSILYTLVKGYSTALLINALDEDSLYLNMWENRGHQLITDKLLENANKQIFLNLAVNFRVSPEYTMFYHLRHTPKSQFLFMSQFNYDLVSNRLKNISYDFFKNYRINCQQFSFNDSKDAILLLAPLSKATTDALYKLIQAYPLLTIKIKLHPFLKSDEYDEAFIETRNIYETLSDYTIIVYSGITTAALELYFQGKTLYKFESESFLDIDPLVDKGLVEKITSLDNIDTKQKHRLLQEEKNYYLGCDNKTLQEILQGMRK